MASSPSYAFVTLLTSDSYLPGALTLVAALRDVHADAPNPPHPPFQTVCIITPETIGVETRRAVLKAFDIVVGVDVIREDTKKGLDLLGRPDLNLVLTKLHVFRLTAFDKIIFLDADVLPIRPLSHLFSLPHEFSAVPDVGWPDIFNSGFMVLTPGLDKFNEIRDLVREKGSWDGGDQGILNEWMQDRWNRLSFTYNTTPTAAYTYAPAYERFGSEIRAIHFIGKNKPWKDLPFRAPGSGASKFSQPAQSSQEAPSSAADGVSQAGTLPASQAIASFLVQPAHNYAALVDKWYNVYDAHYRPTIPTDAQKKEMQARTGFQIPKYRAAWDNLPKKQRVRTTSAISTGINGHAGGIDTGGGGKDGGGGEGGIVRLGGATMNLDELKVLGAGGWGALATTGFQPSAAPVVTAAISGPDAAVGAEVSSGSLPDMGLGYVGPASERGEAEYIPMPLDGHSELKHPESIEEASPVAKFYAYPFELLPSEPLPAHLQALRQEKFVEPPDWHPPATATSEPPSHLFRPKSERPTSPSAGASEYRENEPKSTWSPPRSTDKEAHEYGQWQSAGASGSGHGNQTPTDRWSSQQAEGTETPRPKYATPSQTHHPAQQAPDSHAHPPSSRLHHQQAPHHPHPSQQHYHRHFHHPTHPPLSGDGSSPQYPDGGAEAHGGPSAGAEQGYWQQPERSLPESPQRSPVQPRPPARPLSPPMLTWDPAKEPPPDTLPAGARDFQAVQPLRNVWDMPRHHHQYHPSHTHPQQPPRHGHVPSQQRSPRTSLLGSQPQHQPSPHHQPSGHSPSHHAPHPSHHAPHPSHHDPRHHAHLRHLSHHEVHNPRVFQPMDISASEHSPARFHDEPQEERSPEDFFIPPPQSAIPSQLIREGHYAALTSVNPEPDEKKASPLFPWETKPRPPPGRVFPDMPSVPGKTSPTGALTQRRFDRGRGRTPPPVQSPPSSIPFPKAARTPTPPRAPSPIPKHVTRAFTHDWRAEQKAPALAFPAPDKPGFANAWDTVPSIQRYASRLVQPTPGFSILQPPKVESPHSTYPETPWAEKIEDSDAASHEADDEDDESDLEPGSGYHSPRGDGRRGARRGSGVRSPPNRSGRRGPPVVKVDKGIETDVVDSKTTGTPQYRSVGVQTVPKSTQSRGVQVNRPPYARTYKSSSSSTSPLPARVPLPEVGVGTDEPPPPPRRIPLSRVRTEQTVAFAPTPPAIPSQQSSRQGSRKTSPIRTGVISPRMGDQPSFMPMVLKEPPKGTAVSYSPTITTPAASEPPSAGPFGRGSGFSAGTSSNRNSALFSTGTNRDSIFTDTHTTPRSSVIIEGLPISKGQVPHIRTSSNETGLTGPTATSPPSSVGPPSPAEDDAGTSAPRTRKPTGRKWDPQRDVDIFKNDTQNVLARFLKMGAFGPEPQQQQSPQQPPSPPSPPSEDAKKPSTS
ncbi:glycogenin glucosyltransferase [Tulasnella sp. 424]|nr:glycogenin glucosyltransferase [Tulasnella sp. 424]KAG8975699.1 glycogenin glucosyltransferase [Tulasnella sp. 425]